jgi:Contractile injection system tube protein
MDRVVFIDEDTGDRVSSLLNPESVVVRRSAAVRRLSSSGGVVTGADLSDDPMLVTGGGRTELELDLLFDTALLEGPSVSDGHLSQPGDDLPSRPATDVRSLTRPLWRLAENRSGSGGFNGPPLVRFVWGKAWNVVCVISAIAERLERFGPDGSPSRSWLSVRLARVGEPGRPPEQIAASPAAIAAAIGDGDTPIAPIRSTPAPILPSTSYEVVGPQRLDAVAAEVFDGRSWLWRMLATTNDIENPPLLDAGAVLQVHAVPPMPEPARVGRS